jgi:PTH1 family peptidyl-tRNA hydrolase
MIRLIVGLGNPGPEYEHTRHNAGFWWVDAAARQLGGGLAFDRNYKGLVARINRPEGPVWLLQPMTFMNLSGQSVAPLARFFKIEPAQILVVHDELDLLPGQMKLKQGGGAAGHNGLKDILAQLGSPDFWRLRIGIGHPGVRSEVANWVLRKPPLEDRLAMDQCIADSLPALPLMLDGAMDRALAKVHAKPPRPKPPRPEAASATTAAAAPATAPTTATTTATTRTTTPASPPPAPPGDDCP